MVDHEAYWRPYAGKKEWLMCANIRAMRMIKQVSGVEPFAFLLAESSSIMRTPVLMYCLGESCRRGMGIKLSFDEFVDEGYLPPYLSEEWAHTVNWLEDFIEKAFPWAAEIRAAMRINPAAHPDLLLTMEAAGLLIGTDLSSTPGTNYSYPRTIFTIAGISAT